MEVNSEAQRIFGLVSVFSIFFGLSAVTSCHHAGMAFLSKISINFEFLDWILYFLFSLVYQLLLLSPCKAGPRLSKISIIIVRSTDSLLRTRIRYMAHCTHSHHITQSHTRHVILFKNRRIELSLAIQYVERSIAEWLARLTVNDVFATVQGSIPASSDTVESEGRQMKQC